ncbi:MAG: M20/M25/M40 family metallo-hydrolase [Thermodesulfobacteriota bacterium]
MVNAERLARTFSEVVAIDSVSREEASVARFLQKRLEDLGLTVVMDSAGAAINGDAGNLVGRLKGNAGVPPLVFAAHMDTVEPGRGIQPVLSKGVFRSKGDTVLGADDKSAVAILLEVLEVLREDGIPHGPVEILFTVAEEIGLLGAKNLDYDLVSACMGYVLDMGDTEGIVLRSPSANRMEFLVHGKDAHAGVAPETGINAISVAASAIARLTPGRVDHETTCNIGVIEGGNASNIVPSLVRVKGEARSHDEHKLSLVTREMVAAFEDAVAEMNERVPAGLGQARVDITVESDYTRLDIPEGHPSVVLARAAAEKLGRTLAAKTSGGGFDANILFAHGIVCGILGTGMTDVHTTREYVELSQMVRAAELLLAIIRLHAENPSGTPCEKRPQA